MAGSSVVKSTAKTAMTGKFFKCAVCGIIFIFASIICIYIADFASFIAGGIAGMFLLALLVFFVAMPLFLGTLRFFWRMLFSADDNAVVVFYYFSDKKLYKRAIQLILSIGIRLILTSVILFLPSAIVDAFSGTHVYDMLGMAIPMWVSNLWVVSVFLRTVAFVIVFFIMLRYYLAPVLFVADENIDVAEAIHMSKVISKGTSLDFIYLIFSFTGWIIASIFVIPLVFILPYFIASYLVHSRFAIAHYNMHIEKMKYTNIPTYATGM